MTDPDLHRDIAAEILQRIDDLANLCVKRFGDDRAHKAAVEALAEQLHRAEAGPFREHVYQFVMSTALVIDRLDQYRGADPDFATSIRDELLDVLGRYGVKQVPTDGDFDTGCHEAVRVGIDVKRPPGAVLAVLRRGFARDGWVFRPARVVVNGSEES